MSEAALPLPQPVLHNATYTSREVAELLFRTSLDWFYRHREELIATEAFPRPISSIGQPRWRGADLIAWMSRDRTAAPTGELGFENVLSMRSKSLKAMRR